jgi:hypothetical protein
MKRDGAVLGMRQAMHSAIGGISWARLQRDGSVATPA